MQAQELANTIEEVLRNPSEQFCYYISHIKEAYNALREMHAGKKYYQLLINFPDKEWKNTDVRIPEVRKAYNPYNKPVMWTVVERTSEEPPVAYATLDYAIKRYEKRMSGKRNVMNENFPTWHIVETYRAFPEMITLQNLLHLAQNEDYKIKDWKAFKEIYIQHWWDVIRAIDWMNNKALKEPLTHLRIIAKGKYGKRLENERKLNYILGYRNHEYKILDLEKPIAQITIHNPYVIDKSTMEAISDLLLSESDYIIYPIKEIIKDIGSLVFFTPYLSYKLSKTYFKKDKSIKKAITKGLLGWVLVSMGFTIATTSTYYLSDRNQIIRENLQVILEDGNKPKWFEELYKPAIFGMLGWLTARAELKYKLADKGKIKEISIETKTKNGKGYGIKIKFNEGVPIDEKIYLPENDFIELLHKMRGKNLKELIENP